MMNGGEWGPLCHFFQNWLWHTHFQQLVFHTSLVYSLQQELEMPHWCSGRISVGFDARVDYVSMRHLTEPAPYTGQFLTPAGTHSVSDGTYIFYHRTPSGVHGMFHFCLFHSSSSITICIEWPPGLILATNFLISSINVRNIVRHLQGEWGVGLGVKCEPFCEFLANLWVSLSYLIFTTASFTMLMCVFSSYNECTDALKKWSVWNAYSEEMLFFSVCVGLDEGVLPYLAGILN